MSPGSPPSGRPPLGGWILFISVYETTPSMGRITCFYIIIKRFLAMTSAANEHRKLNRGGPAILALHWWSVLLVGTKSEWTPLSDLLSIYLKQVSVCRTAQSLWEQEWDAENILLIAEVLHMVVTEERSCTALRKGPGLNRKVFF